MIKVRLELFIGIKQTNSEKQMDVQDEDLLKWRIYRRDLIDNKNPPIWRIFYFESNFSIFSFCPQIVKIFSNKLATVIGPTHQGTGLIA